MIKSVACAFALALTFSGCSEDVEQALTPLSTLPSDFNPSEQGIPLDVSGNWRYGATAKKHDCLCLDCHYDIEQEFFEEQLENPELIAFQGLRTIVQEGEDLQALDHKMSIQMAGNLRVFSGHYSCGGTKTINSDNSVKKWSYAEFGKFHSNADYESTLTVIFSDNDEVCRIIWSIDGRRAE